MCTKINKSATLKSVVGFSFVRISTEISHEIHGRRKTWTSSSLSRKCGHLQWARQFTFHFCTIISVIIDGTATQQTQTSEFYEKLDDFFSASLSQCLQKCFKHPHRMTENTNCDTYFLPMNRSIESLRLRLRFIRIWVNKRKNVFRIRHRALNSLSICLSSISLKWCPILFFYHNSRQRKQSKWPNAFVAEFRNKRW